jgi:hypothetical protein
MKTMLGAVLGVLIMASSAFALTATWSKDTELDMKDYGVYMCFTKGCVVTKTTAMLQSYVSHQATVNPSYPVPPNTEGTVAVTARDLSGNESGLSVQVPFDQSSPVPPVSLTVQ